MNKNKFEGIEKISHKELTSLAYEIIPLLQGNASDSLLHALLYAIDKGNNHYDSLKNYFNIFFCEKLPHVKLSKSHIEEYLEIGKKNSLIQEKDTKFVLTDKGNEVLFKAQKVIFTQKHFVKLFFSERVILLISLICLILMSSMKIYIGLNTGSEALFNDGIENFTDIIKIFIISLSIKYSKDKLGSIVIIIMMLITGISLIISSIISLIKNEIITPTYWAFVLVFFSIIINFILMFFKNIVGKSTGNFSLMSDAKDNINNIRLSAGVFVGLIFAIFGIYFIDALIGIFISALIIYDGIETLLEVIKSGDDIEIDTFKLRVDEGFEFKIAHWLLLTIKNEELSKDMLNSRFIQAVEKSYQIYDIWTTFGLYNIEKYGIYKILNLMEKRGLIIEENNKILLTNKGIQQYEKAKVSEKRKINRQRKRYEKWKRPTKKKQYFSGFIIFIILVLILFVIIFIGPILYDILI